MSSKRSRSKSPKLTAEQRDVLARRKLHHLGVHLGQKTSPKKPIEKKLVFQETTKTFQDQDIRDLYVHQEQQANLKKLEKKYSKLSHQIQVSPTSETIHVKKIKPILKTKPEPKLVSPIQVSPKKSVQFGGTPKKVIMPPPKEPLKIFNLPTRIVTISTNLDWFTPITSPLLGFQDEWSQHLTHFSKIDDIDRILLSCFLGNQIQLST